jgi:hypothetical protein
MIYGMVWGKPDHIESIFHRNPNFSPEVIQPVLECGSRYSDQLLKNSVEGPSKEQIFITVKSFTDDAGVPELANEIMNNWEVLFNSKMIGQHISEVVVMFPNLAIGKSSEFMKSDLFHTASSALEGIKVSKPGMEEEYRQVIYYMQFWYSNYMLSKLN